MYKSSILTLALVAALCSFSNAGWAVVDTFLNFDCSVSSSPSQPANGCADEVLTQIGIGPIPAGGKWLYKCEDTQCAAVRRDVPAGVKFKDGEVRINIDGSYECGSPYVVASDRKGCTTG